MSADERPEVATTGTRIEIESMVSGRTREPFVVLRWGAEGGQLTPMEARQHARRLLEAAEAADQDAFLVDFLRDRVGVDVPQQMAVLLEFREWRAKRDPEIEVDTPGVQ